MKKIITTCDRCGNATEQDGLYYEIENGDKAINLCEVCWNDFKLFMEEKGIVHLWRRKNVEVKWVGDWDGFGGDPENPFPLKKKSNH